MGFMWFLDLVYLKVFFSFRYSYSCWKFSFCRFWFSSFCWIMMLCLRFYSWLFVGLVGVQENIFLGLVVVYKGKKKKREQIFVVVSFGFRIQGYRFLNIVWFVQFSIRFLVQIILGGKDCFLRVVVVLYLIFV